MQRVQAQRGHALRPGDGSEVREGGEVPDALIGFMAQRVEMRGDAECAGAVAEAGGHKALRRRDGERGGGRNALQRQPVAAGRQHRQVDTARRDAAAVRRLERRLGAVVCRDF